MISKVGCRTLVATTLAIVVSVLSAGEALAVTGWVTGSWEFWNVNGNYCPATANCTGALYPQSQFDTRLPMANAKVQIVDSSFAVIGQGVTATNGTYTVSWTRNTKPSTFRVLVLTVHSRFWIATPSGASVYSDSGPITTASSSSSSSPQNIGTLWQGSSAAPSPYWNAYWGAERLWRGVLSLLGSAITNFTNVEVRGFANDMPTFLGSRATSASDGPAKKVQLDANAAYAPQARVMHELGHIALYQVGPWTRAYNYLWGPMGDDSNATGWDPTTPEYGSVVFEEAMASHLANLTLWDSNSQNPTFCWASRGTCFLFGAPSPNTNIETTSYPYATNNCGTDPNSPEQRWALSGMRFLWDIFDDHNDADGDSYSASVGHFWQHLAMTSFYPAGTGANQKDEPWNGNYTSIAEPDGKGTSSYQSNYEIQLGTATNASVLHIDNCWPM